MSRSGPHFKEEDFPDLLPVAPAQSSKDVTKKDKVIMERVSNYIVQPGLESERSLKPAGGGSLLTTKRTKKMGLFDIMNIQASKQSKKVTPRRAA